MLRALRRDRGFVALFVLTTTLAVGATTSVFAVANALFWRPQPVDRPDQLVALTLSGQTQDASRASERSLEDLAEAPVFSGVAGQAVKGVNGFDLTPHIAIDGSGVELETIGVTTNYFDVLGVRVRGRTFTASDNQYAAEPVAIISDALWSTAFARDPGIIGQRVAARPMALTIAGIAQPGFRGLLRGERTDVWIPVRQIAAMTGIAPEKLADAGIPLLGIHRMRDGVTIAGVNDWLASSRWGAVVKGGAHREVTRISSLFGTGDMPVVSITQGPTIEILAGVSLLVAFGGAMTLMGLILVHYERRRHEFSIRLALGASRARLCRQLIGELIALTGTGAIGAALATIWVTRLMPQFVFANGVDLGRLDLRMDWRVTVGSIAVCVTATTIAALVPMVRSTRPNLDRHAGSHASTATLSSIRLRQVVIGAHVATSVAVLLVAALLATSVKVGSTQGPGFEADRTIFVSMHAWSERRVDDRASGRRDAATKLAVLIDRVLAEPGVNSAALGMAPIGSDAAFAVTRSRAVDTSTEQRQLEMGLTFVGRRYFETLDVPLIGVEALRESEAVITDTLATELWPDESPLGKTMKIADLPEVTVVGIASVGFGSLTHGRPAAAFLGGLDDASRAGVGPRLSLLINVQNPSGAQKRIAQLAREVFPDAPQITVATGRQRVDDDLSPQRLGRWFLQGFAAIALTLSVTGIFGLVAYLAHSRRREFGIMAALGATHGRIIRQAADTGFRPALIGMAVGAMAAWWLRATLASFLLGVTNIDVLLWVQLGALVLVGAAVGAIAAAMRLRRLSPLDALRD